MADQRNHDACDPPGKQFYLQSMDATHQPTRAANSMPPSKPKSVLAISNLMSPPEADPYDNFHHGQQSASISPVTKQVSSNPQLPVSPPISPFSTVNHQVAPNPDSTIHATGLNDPVLYPSSEGPSSPPRSLFADAGLNNDGASDVIESHIAARAKTNLFPPNVSPPNRQDYENILYFKSCMMEGFLKDPRAWLKREKGFLKAESLARQKAGVAFNDVIQPNYRPSANPKAALVARTASSRVSKPQKTQPPLLMKRQNKEPATRPVRAKPLSTKNAQQVNGTSEPKKQDTDYASVPDYCPPVDSLMYQHAALKATWPKGSAAVDLSSDSDAHLLHRDELKLAADLRLSCAGYLTSKRRIFERRLECLTMTPPKEFRKTDAQQACRIDVNKASKLWTAFNDVGWLASSWMKPEWVEEVRKQRNARN